MNKTTHNLYDDNTRRFVAHITFKHLIWTQDRVLAKKLSHFGLLFWRVYLFLRFQLKVRRSSIISFETKVENKVDMK